MARPKQVRVMWPNSLFEPFQPPPMPPPMPVWLKATGHIIDAIVAAALVIAAYLVVK